MEFKIISDDFGHEFCSLIGVKICGDTPRDKKCILDHCDDECSIVIFANVGRKDLAGSQILNRRQIPKLSLEFKVRHVTNPDEMRDKCIFGNICNQVGVVVVVGRDGTEVVVFSPRCLDSVEAHHPLGSLVVHLQVERHFVLPVRWVVNICLVDSLHQRLVFARLYGMAIDILPGDAEGICTDGFDVPSRDQLNFFSPDSNQG